MAPTVHDFRSKYGATALVTGASSGIGAALANEIAARGLDVVLVARRDLALAELAERIRASHDVRVTCIVADLGTTGGVNLVLDRVSPLDIGLYAGCAGFGTAGHFTDNSIDDELNMIDVNCRAVAALAHPVAQSMRKRGRGGIILFSSIVAFQGVGNSANYAATKAYVQSLAEGLAAELRPNGVDVLASAPGPVATGFGARADMRMNGAASAQVVARATLNALGRKTTVRPGTQSKVLGLGLSTLPRPLRSRILGQIMTGMTKHRHAAS